MKTRLLYMKSWLFYIETYVLYIKTWLFYRLWEKTQEPLVLEDERETEREHEEEQQLATGDRPQDQDREAGLPSKKSAETERSAERLMEAINTYRQYQEECNEAKAQGSTS